MEAFLQSLESFFSEFQQDFYTNFIKEDRWLHIVEGLYNTLRITFFAVLIGIAIGVVVAIIRSSYDLTHGGRKNGIGKKAFSLLNGICNVYLTVIRGTPVVVQLMIMYYVIIVSDRNGITSAILAFGINSGAYVAEIMRSGIMSIDTGQMEAGRTLGFNYVQTMFYIVLPQALKNTLPALANEFIALLKETSVAGYVTIKDLTRGGDIIRSRTYNAVLPLGSVALLYLILVMIFTAMISRLERRLRSSDH